MAETKHAGGRPLKYKTLKDMQPLIDTYFDETPVTQQTITGLAMALDTDRTTLINYEKRDQFFDAIKRAKTRIENAYELSLRVRGGAGDIFGLKNFGWTDKTEVENSGETKVIVETRQVKRLSVPSKVIEHEPDDS